MPVMSGLGGAPRFDRTAMFQQWRTCAAIQRPYRQGG